MLFPDSKSFQKSSLKCWMLSYTSGLWNGLFYSLLVSSNSISNCLILVLNFQLLCFCFFFKKKSSISDFETRARRQSSNFPQYHSISLTCLLIHLPARLPACLLTCLSEIMYVDFLLGLRCEKNIDERASNPCVHGMCLDFYNKFECSCIPGWSGKLCDVEINECETGPCKNGGYCTDGIANYTCKCPSGFMGRNCEIVPNVNECISSPCKNGGTCQDLLNNYFCLCPPGFLGRNCEIYERK